MTSLSLSVQYATDATELPRWRIRSWVRQALNAASQDIADPIEALILTIRIVGQDEARALNHEYRQRDYATNVLTFNFDPPSDQPDLYQSDIVLCHDVLVAEAQAQHKTLQSHAAHLCVHATLHALGYDHEDEAEATKMESLETAILARMGIADPYE